MALPNDTIPLLRGEFTKLEPARQIAWGWASVVSVDGADIVDLQDDVLDLQSLEDSVLVYMAESRQTGSMHQEFGIGKVVESFVATPEKLAAFGMTSKRMGWLVGVKVEDTAAWEDVASGKFTGFSIGGVGEYEAAA